MGALQEKFNFTIPQESIEHYVKEEENQVIAKLLEKCRECVGCTEQLVKLEQGGKYGLAVVSSSALRRVQASLTKVGMDKFFPKDHVFSAATSLPKPTSKPDPAVYLHACEVLGKKTSECVAVEDSKSGTLSAVRAGIPVIGYVGSYETPEKIQEMKGVLKETGAAVVMEHWHEFPAALAQIEGESAAL